jgi:hypothetical protein
MVADSPLCLLLGVRGQGGAHDHTGARSARTAHRRRGVWGIEGLAREIGDRVSTLDAVAQLDRVGLLNRINKWCVCASRAVLVT